VKQREGKPPAIPEEMRRVDTRKRGREKPIVFRKPLKGRKKGENNTSFPWGKGRGGGGAFKKTDRLEEPTFQSDRRGTAAQVFHIERKKGAFTREKLRARSRGIEIDRGEKWHLFTGKAEKKGVF